MNGYFRILEDTENLTIIEDLTGVFMYLIKGSASALLVDTGSGLGNIKEYVDKLTNLSYTVVCTHGHGDHAGGNAWFKEVYLAEEDFEVERTMSSPAWKSEFIEFATGKKPMNIELAPVRKDDYVPLRDGKIFDLGGITVEVISVPGHTQGMKCILIRELRKILFSDACNPTVFLFLDESSTVEEYKASLLNLKKRSKEYDTVYLSHHPVNVPCNILDECIEVCDRIVQRKSDDQPFTFMEYNVFSAMEMDGNVRKDGKLGNIIYSKEKNGIK